MAQGTEVGNNTFISHSVIGRNCKIGANVKIVGSYIWNGATVADGATISYSIVCNEARIMAGARVSLSVAAGAAFGALIIGTVLGLCAGFFRGIVDILLTRIVDLMLAIPGLVMALGIVVLLGPSASSVTIALIAVYSWQFARIVRSAVVSVRGRPYVEAARGLGVSSGSVLFRDVFPSVMPVLVVQLATAFAWGVLDEASIGFLGLGVQPPNPSWGSLLIEGRQYIYDAPWLSIGAGIMVVLAVFGVNLLGDGLNDIVDPRSGAAK